MITPRRRSFVLVATLVAIVLISLSAMGVAVIADVNAEGVHTESRRLQARALAWSGVQCVAVELARQRNDLLAARPPRLTPEWTIYEADGGPVERGVARLIEINAQWAAPETARIDLNLASREQLVSILGDEEASDAIASQRSTRPFASPEEAGPTLHDRGTAELSEPDRDPSNARPDIRSPDDHLDRFTVFSADPSIQLGTGANGTRFAGRPRIDVSRPFSVDLAAALTERLGVEIGQPLSDHLRERGPMRSLADLAAWLTSRQVPVPEWTVPFDAVACSPAEFLSGRVDINAAPAEVLAAIPGIDRDAADRIVLRRRALDPSVRQSIVWPLAENLLSPEQFTAAADHLTARSLIWRFRLEAGFVEGKTEPGRPAELRYRVCYEAVVDLAGETPRLAYLRDVTALEYADSAAVREMQSAPEESPTESPQSSDRIQSAPPSVSAPSSRPPAEPPSSDPDSSNVPDTTAPSPARIGRWTAGAAVRPEDKDDAATPGSDHP